MTSSRGMIELICGPMFAGKTTALLARLDAARGQGRRVVAVKPAGDTRSGAAELRSHTGSSVAARPIATAGELADAASNAALVGIDEVHFFGPQLAEACVALAARGTDVVAAGVDLDHHGRWFDTMTALRDVADQVHCLTATCGQCGGVARYTQRLVAGSDRIVVGGAGDYEARCEACFNPPSE